MSPRLFLQVASMEARKAMSYRAAFWATAVVGLVTGFAIPWFLWRSIFELQGVERIGGLTFNAMILYYVVVSLLSKVVRGSDMGLGLSREIYQGTLTRYLVFPTQVIVFKYAQQLGNMLPLLLQAAAIATVFACFFELPMDLQIGVGSVSRALVSVLLAHLVYYFMTIPITAVAFWADNVWSLAVLLRFSSSFLGGGMIPLDLFPQGVRDLLTLLPFPYLFYQPVQTLLGRTDPGEWALGVAVTLVWCGFFALLAHLVWKLGERRYTGVGI
ncbi:MAG: ABC transporter permease [Planctomycetota bacterium]